MLLPLLCDVFFDEVQFIFLFFGAIILLYIVLNFEVLDNKATALLFTYTQRLIN